VCLVELGVVGKSKTLLFVQLACVNLEAVLSLQRNDRAGVQWGLAPCEVGSLMTHMCTHDFGGIQAQEACLNTSSFNGVDVVGGPYTAGMRQYPEVNAGASG
jgi:hypothetical protein